MISTKKLELELEKKVPVNILQNVCTGKCLRIKLALLNNVIHVHGKMARLCSGHYNSQLLLLLLRF